MATASGRHELVVGVNVALGNRPVAVCPAFGASRDGHLATERWRFA